MLTFSKKNANFFLKVYYSQEEKEESYILP